MLSLGMSHSRGHMIRTWIITDCWWLPDGCQMVASLIKHLRWATKPTYGIPQRNQPKPDLPPATIRYSLKNDEYDAGHISGWQQVDRSTRWVDFSWENLNRKPSIFPWNMGFSSNFSLDQSSVHDDATNVNIYELNFRSLRVVEWFRRLVFIWYMVDIWWMYSGYSG